MKDDFSATPPRINSRRDDFAMKSHLSRKIHFLKICLALCASVLLFACDLFQETPKDFLEDYGSIASVAKTEFSVEPVLQGAWQNIGSSGDVTINYVVDNPGNHRLRAKISFPEGCAFSNDDIVFGFSENDGLLQSWTEIVDDGAGGTAQTSRTESETNFLKSAFSITFPQALLLLIDGDVSRFDISPTVTLYRAEFGAEERPQSSHTIRLRCNTPPADISNAMGEKIVADGKEGLVLAIALPALKVDDKYLTVEENGRTHIFDLPISDGATSSDAFWTISSVEPAGIEAATFDENGNPITPANDGDGWIPNCYITTDIDIKGLAPFDIALTLTDEGGLTSKKVFTSHGRKLDPPNSTSPAKLEQNESDGMATYTVQAIDGATIHYTVTQTAGGAYGDSGSGASPLAIPLPAGTFTITAHAEKEGFARSDDFTKNVTVNPSVFFVSAEGSDDPSLGNGSKSAPFATIKKAVESFTPAPASAQIFLLSDIFIRDGDAVSITDTNLTVRGCKDGNAGSRVAISCALTSGSPFAIGGNVNMFDLDISQTADSIASGGVDKAISVVSGGTLGMENVSISGMKTSSSGILVESGGTLNLKNVSINGNTTSDSDLNISGGALRLEGDLNISGGVKIIGNTSASGDSLNLYLPDGKTLAIHSGSLAETQIGVTTETEPSSTVPAVIITRGFYGTNPASVFSSDKNYALSLNSNNEVQFKQKGAGGTITPITPPSEIKFKISESGTGGAITIDAFADDGTPIDASELTNWAISIDKGVSTGYRFSTNTFTFPTTLDAGTYTIHIEVKYGGKDYSDDLTYTKS